MIAYIEEIICQIHSAISENRLTGQPALFELLMGLAEELNRLDPRDFGYGVRSSFVINRLGIRSFALEKAISGSRHTKILDICSNLSESLKDYHGDGSRAILRCFDFMSDEELKKIVVRDYKEVSLILMPGGAWKSVVVLAGSILEAILTDVLAANSSLAYASSRAPAKKKLEQGEWRLIDLIHVAEELNKIPRESAQAIDQVLRDYRNFIHPKKEIRAQHPCREAQALMAKGALDAVCDHLSKN